MRKIILLFCYLGFISAASLQASKPPRRPKNIILIIGDGTGLAQLYAAYTAKGGKLNIYQFAQYTGLSMTSSFDDYITDSGAGGTAISAGKKTRNGMVGTGPDSMPIPTLPELAAAKGLSTGTVVTCELTHATPASFFAHQPSRKMYPEIAKDMTNGRGDLLIGGGYPYFDTAELRKRGFTTSIGMEAMKNNTGKRQICFYNTDSSVQKATVRGNALEMGCRHAVQKLSRNKKGFFLMVEGSQVDWGGHDNDSAYLLNEALDLDSAAGFLFRWAMTDKRTLVIVTADHECGGLTLHGKNTWTGHPVMHFSTGHHTAEPVPVYAFGPGAAHFTGVYENTELFFRMKKLLRL
ncbi:MAG: alkaline phosphatase [Bacteroidetes bacterium]|nr:alkaline phosphatase [Bacteroidota bacterium]